MNIRASILRGMFRPGVKIVELWMNWRIKDNIKIRKENMHEIQLCGYIGSGHQCCKKVL